MQNNCTLIVDPDCRGLEDHWAKTAFDLLVGVVIFVLVCEFSEGVQPDRSLAAVLGILSDSDVLPEVAESSREARAQAAKADAQSGAPILCATDALSLMVSTPEYFRIAPLRNTPELRHMRWSSSVEIGGSSTSNFCTRDADASCGTSWANICEPGNRSRIPRPIPKIRRFSIPIYNRPQFQLHI